MEVEGLYPFELCEDMARVFRLLIELQSFGVPEDLVDVCFEDSACFAKLVEIVSTIDVSDVC